MVVSSPFDVFKSFASDFGHGQKLLPLLIALIPGIEATQSKMESLNEVNKGIWTGLYIFERA